MAAKPAPISSMIRPYFPPSPKEGLWLADGYVVRPIE